MGFAGRIMARKRPCPMSAAIAGATLLALCAAATAANLAGSVVGLSGAVGLDRNGQRYTLRIGDPVYTDDTLQVASNAKLKLRLNDGSILSLAPGSTLRIDTFVADGGGRRQSAIVSLGQGLLRSVTAPAGQPAAFEVNTAVGISGVRSTDWFVEAGPGYQQVAVLSGSVSLTSRATGRGVVVPAGAGTRLEAGRDPAPPSPVSPGEFAVLIAQTDDSVPAAVPAPGGYPPPGYYPPGPVIQIPFPGGGGYRPRPEPGGHPNEPGGSRPPPSRGRPG
jgi:ferric-dicitrate binding protein FerR (iron transport regulator)